VVNGKRLPFAPLNSKKLISPLPPCSQVDVKLVRPLARPLLLRELKGYASKELSGMPLFKQSRLSVQPVTPEQWEFILSLENSKPS
jgi:predicted RNA-binding protein with PUA-like domain